jgi:hypothetical protein
MFGAAGSTASEVTRVNGSRSIPVLDGVQLIPPFALLNTPCPGTPEYTTSRFVGSTTSESIAVATRPALVAVHVNAASTDSNTPAWLVPAHSVEGADRLTASAGTPSPLRLFSGIVQVTPPSGLFLTPRSVAA